MTLSAENFPAFKAEAETCQETCVPCIYSCFLCSNSVLRTPHWLHTDGTEMREVSQISFFPFSMKNFSGRPMEPILEVHGFE